MDHRLEAIRTLVELHRKKTTTKAVWREARSGAETTLVLGVLRRRATLDAIARAYATRKLHLLKPETLAVLRTALFELLFLDDTPAFAAIHAAVEHTRQLGRARDCGFVNAVLRAVDRGSRRVEQGSSRDLRRTLPRESVEIEFEKSVFPDPKRDVAGFLAARGSTARWIAARRLAELGFDRALHCLELQAKAPRVHLRPAPGRAGDVRAALAERGIGVFDGPHDALLTLEPGARLGEVMEACGGLAVVQDAVASQVAPFAGPAAGSRVLDLCAAPGGKATHLAQLVGVEGRVTAWDADPGRLALVEENAARLGLEQLRCGPPEGDYATVLVDAPCSNTGVLARRPEARWRVKERHLPGLAQRQLRILKDAAGFVAPGGALVYSTCSVEAEENAGVVQALLAARPGGFRLEESRLVHADEGFGDGGFMARLRAV